MDKTNSVGFIGGGNMTRAIAGGLLQDGFPAANLSISEPLAEQRALLLDELPGVFVDTDSNTVVARSAALVLAVKPQIIAAVCRDLATPVRAARPVIISIAAGPRIADVDEWLGGANAVVRVMPNQPALIRRGVSGLFANAATNAQQLSLARSIMTAVGPVVTVNSEAEIDAVTAVSGSGPAYFYLLIDMLTNAGAELGLAPKVASELALETARGAAELAAASGESMQELIERVRSPGGTTAAALDSLEDQGIRDIFTTALIAARDRATALADAAHTSAQD